MLDFEKKSAKYKMLLAHDDDRVVDLVTGYIEKKKLRTGWRISNQSEVSSRSLQLTQNTEEKGSKAADKQVGSVFFLYELPILCGRYFRTEYRHRTVLQFVGLLYKKY